MKGKKSFLIFILLICLIFFASCSKGLDKDEDLSKTGQTDKKEKEKDRADDSKDKETPPFTIKDVIRMPKEKHVVDLKDSEDKYFIDLHDMKDFKLYLSKNLKSDINPSGLKTVEIGYVDLKNNYSYHPIKKFEDDSRLYDYSVGDKGIIYSIINKGETKSDSVIASVYFEDIFNKENALLIDEFKLVDPLDSPTFKRVGDRFFFISRRLVSETKLDISLCQYSDNKLDVIKTDSKDLESGLSDKFYMPGLELGTNDNITNDPGKKLLYYVASNGKSSKIFLVNSQSLEIKEVPIDKDIRNIVQFDGKNIYYFVDNENKLYKYNMESSESEALSDQYEKGYLARGLQSLHKIFYVTKDIDKIVVYYQGYKEQKENTGFYELSIKDLDIETDTWPKFYLSNEKTETINEVYLYAVYTGDSQISILSINESGNR